MQWTAVSSQIETIAPSVTNRIADSSVVSSFTLASCYKLNWNCGALKERKVGFLPRDNSLYHQFPTAAIIDHC